MKIYVGYMDEWGEENLLGLFKSESEVDDAVYQKLDNAELIGSGSVDSTCSYKKFEFENFQGDRVEQVIYIKEVDLDWLLVSRRYR